MGQALRHEDPDEVCFITTRTLGSLLWFINNKRLEERILAYLARYSELFGVILYAFIIMGNHYHLIARFPNANRASFMQAFNSRVATLVKFFSSGCTNRLWARRYSSEALPREGDVLHWFFYLILNPISSGICKKIETFKQYNSFFDSINQTPRKYKIIHYGKLKDRRRFNRRVTPEQFTTEHSLIFHRLPGFEGISQEKYKKVLLEMLSTRSEAAVQKRLESGKGFASDLYLQAQRRGTAPSFTKTSARYSRRPLVLTLCMHTRKKWLGSYFARKRMHEAASLIYRKNGINYLFLPFPPGTYRPPILERALLKI